MGTVHITSACFALFFGSLVLFMRKGSRNHIRAGYGYVYSMVVMLTSSAMITSLYGGFGPFHVATIISSVVTALGMIPVIRRKPAKHWKVMHFYYMYWSVIGLYAALFSEIFTRVPKTPFFGMVIFATLAVTLIGAFFFIRLKPKWEKAFGI